MKQLIAVLLLIPLLGSADPGPATKYLMDEPASLMDIGLLRMRLDLTSTTLLPVTRIIVDENEDEFSGLSLLTEYDYANDMIIVRLFLFGESDEAEQDCKFAVGILASAVKRGLGDWFSHSDFKRGNPPSLEDLQSRTSVVCEAEFPDLEQVVVTRRLDQRTPSVRKD